MIFNIWKFENKQPDENVIIMIRRHPMVLLRLVFEILAILAIAIGIMIYFGFNWVTIIILIVGILISIILIMAYSYLWLNDVYVLTDQRLIDVDQKNIFSRIVTETSLDQIQDVTSEISGLMPSVLNFGKIAIQTAGATQNIVLEAVPNPNFVQHEISKAFHNYRARMGFSVNSEVKNE